MAYCKFPADHRLFDITPVENLFIMEHMPTAPGDYVRVYLYGLMLCRYPDESVTAEDFAKTLNMKAEDVASAFRYWERAGLVMRMSDRPPCYQYISPRTAALAGMTEADDNDPYRYKDYFNGLQRIFGSDRLLDPNEQAKALDWIETLKLPEKVALYMTERLVERARENRRSLRYIFRDLDATAMIWANEDIKTIEQADAWLERDSAAAQAAKAVLKQLGAKRAPTADELAMAKVWVDEWNLGKEQIVESCASMTNTSNPSFAYLNGILKRRVSGDSIEHYPEIRRVLTALGGSGMPTSAQSETYARLLSLGFEHDAIEYAAGQCSQKGKHTFEALERRLEAWQKEGIMTRRAAEEYARRREPGERMAAIVYEELGITGVPTQSDAAQTEEWMRVFPEDVIMLAAERSKGAQRAWLYMQRVLRAWAEKGIKTRAEAEAESAARTNVQPRIQGQNVKVNPAREYGQRDYDDEEMKNIALDLSQLPGEDE